MPALPESLVESTLTAGLGTYGDSFIGHYLVPVIYPPGLTPAIQYLLAAIVVVVNGVVYALVWKRRR